MQKRAKLKIQFRPFWAFLSLLCTMIFVSSIVWAQSGGDMGSSGGGYGVACFKDPDNAVAASKISQQGKALPIELKQNISSLKTLEIWEWEKDHSPLLIDSASANYVSILKHVQQNIEKVSPIFARRMEQVADQIQITRWRSIENLIPTRDAHPTRPIPAGCSLVPLVRRISKGDHKRGLGPVSKMPQLYVQVDADLFAILDDFNKSVLFVHEQIYVFGKAIGQATSDIIRPIVLRFFAKTLDLALDDQVFIDEQNSLRYTLVNRLGDYPLYFTTDDRLNWSPLLPAQGERFHSYIKMLKLLRTKYADCTQAKTQHGKTILSKDQARACADQEVGDNRRLIGELTPEQAFLSLSMRASDKEEGLINSEYLIAPVTRRDQIPNVERVMNQACYLLSQQRRDEENLRISGNDLPLFQIAISYCHSIGLNQFN